MPFFSEKTDLDASRPPQKNAATDCSATALGSYRADHRLASPLSGFQFSSFSRFFHFLCLLFRVRGCMFSKIFQKKQQQTTNPFRLAIKHVFLLAMNQMPASSLRSTVFCSTRGATSKDVGGNRLPGRRAIFSDFELKST